MTGERRHEVELEAPGHPALPARVSLLMFPARGAVARLLEPRDASAVIGSIETGIRARRLRRFRGSGWRRNSDMLGDSSRPESYLKRQARFQPRGVPARVQGVESAVRTARDAADTVPVGRAARDYGDGP